MAKKNNAGSFFRKHWIVIWIAVVSLILSSVIIAWAAYTDANQKIKRVIAPAASTGGLFTSNYLKPEVGSIQYAYFNSGDTISFDVIVRNYNPSDINTIFDTDIPYTFTATLVHSNGTAYVSDRAADAPEGTPLLSLMTGKSIVITNGTDTITIDDNNLSGSDSSHRLTSSHKDDTWTVQFNNIDIGSDYCIKIEAEPAVESLDTLSATILVVPYPQVHPEGWSCAIEEPINQDVNSAVNDYDGFNYVLSGTGARTLEFRYDSTRFIVNPASYQFFDEIIAPANIEGRPGWKKIVINADPSTTGNNRYDFQLYKIGGWIPDSFQLLPEKTGSYVEFTQSIPATP